MNTYDIIIIWWWASGLFCSAFLPKGAKKCILEKSEKLWTKLLLSGWERCNVTNTQLDPSCYVGQNTKMLPSVFHHRSQQDMIDFLQGHGVETVVEDHGRVLLKSGKAKELLELLTHLAHENDTEIFLNQNVLGIWNLSAGIGYCPPDKQIPDKLINHFSDKTFCHDWYQFVVWTNDITLCAKNIIIASGGMTYPQVGASAFGYEIAEQLWLEIVAPHGALCGIETHEETSALAWSTVQTWITLYHDNKIVYKNAWSLLFTHRGVSGPIIFDATLHIDQDISKYSFQLEFDLSATSKKVVQAFKLVAWDTQRDFRLKAVRPISEAKVSVGGILLRELDQHFQSRKIPGLYFIGEALDITGKTGGYNLQRAWSSAYVCAEGMK